MTINGRAIKLVRNLKVYPFDNFQEKLLDVFTKRILFEENMPDIKLGEPLSPSKNIFFSTNIFKIGGLPLRSRRQNRG